MRLRELHVRAYQEVSEGLEIRTSRCIRILTGNLRRKHAQLSRAGGQRIKEGIEETFVVTCQRVFILAVTREDAAKLQRVRARDPRHAAVVVLLVREVVVWTKTLQPAKPVAGDRRNTVAFVCKRQRRSDRRVL